MENLVAAVDQKFQGTSSIYYASIWDWFQDTHPDIGMVRARMERLLQENGLVRTPPESAVASNELFQAYGAVTIFDRCILLSLRHLDDFSQLELIWLLYLQTEPSHSANYRAVLEEIADKWFDDFFAVYGEPKNFNFYVAATKALLRSRLNLTNSNEAGYGPMEAEGKWAVVPKELAGKLTKEHLPSTMFAMIYSDKTE